MPGTLEASIAEAGIVMSCTIALLTPYGGTNLGDQAIQFSFVDNLRRLPADVDLIGLTLNPERTAQIHGIACYPITALDVDFYSESLFLPSASPGPASSPEHPAAAAGEESKPLLTALRTRLRRVRSLVACVHAARRLPRKLKGCLRELGFLVFAWRLVGRLRLLIVAGGGQIDDEWGGPWGHPYALARWTVLARLRGVPVAFASVGACRLEGRLSRGLMGTALRLAQFRSYRDEGSKVILRRWAFTRGDPCFPDAAFALFEGGGMPPGGAGRDVIGISPIAFGRPESWPTRSEGVYAGYIAALADFVIALCERGLRIAIFTTSGADSAAVRDLLRQIETQRVGLPAGIDVQSTQTVASLQALLPRLRAVVASRLHGVMLSHIGLVPVLAISFDRKVDEHMADMELGEYCTGIRDIRAADLTRMFERLLSREQAVRALIRERVRERADRVREQFALLGALAGCGSARPAVVGE